MVCHTSEMDKDIFYGTYNFIGNSIELPVIPLKSIFSLNLIGISH